MHNLLQSNAQPTRQEHIIENEEYWPGPYKAPESELEYKNPPNLVNVDYDYMMTKEILENISHIPVLLEYLNPITPMVLGPTQQLTIQQLMQQVADLTTPHLTTNPKATPTSNQALPKLNYVIVTASLGWKQVQSQRAKVRFLARGDSLFLLLLQLVEWPQWFS